MIHQALVDIVDALADQSWKTESARISRCWDNQISTVIGEEYLPRGFASGLGSVAVVRPSDYRRWWHETGKDRGAPDPQSLLAGLPEGERRDER